MNCACRPKDALLCRSCLEHIQRKFGNSISFSGTPEIQRKAIELEQQNAALVGALKDLDTRIMPEKRKYDEWGYCRIHKDIVYEFDAIVTAALLSHKTD